MSDLLAGGISDLFAGVFGAIYLDASIRKLTPIDNGKGGVTVPNPADTPCKVQIDSVTEAMRQAENYTVTDVALIILNPGFVVDSDCEVTMSAPDGRLFKCAAPITSDPARSYYLARGRV